MYREWKSIAEDKPIHNSGLLFKIIPNNEKYGSTRTEDIYISGKFFFGFFWPCEYVYITAAILPNGQIQTMGWKATKEYYPDEIYWLYNYEQSQEDNKINN